jgi:hypothetical protein
MGTMNAKRPTLHKDHPTAPYLLREEAIERFSGEWVLMRVTAFDLAGWPYYGAIVAHSRSRQEISERLAQEPRPADQPCHTPYYVFKATPRTRSGDDFDRGAAELAAAINAKLGEHSAGRRR